MSFAVFAGAITPKSHNQKPIYDKYTWAIPVPKFIGLIFHKNYNIKKQFIFIK